MALIELNDRAVQGIENFLTTYLELRPDDGVIVSFERTCMSTVAWLIAALRLREQAHSINPFTRYDEEERFATILEQNIGAMGRTEHVQRINLLCCERDTLSFTMRLKRLVRTRPDLVVRRILNVTPELFELAFSYSPRDLKQINAGLLHRLMPTRSFRIKSDLGTDIEVQNDSDQYKWVSNFGTPDPGELVVLPAGEVNVFPASISGRFVANGAINCNFPIGCDARLQENPIIVEIEDGVVRDFQCHNKLIHDVLQRILEDPPSRNVGEFGIGTNLGIDRFIALNSHINERHPGVHIGIGQHGQPGTVHYEARFHLDLISPSCTVYVSDGGPPICTDHLTPSPILHPTGTHCEDVEHYDEVVAWT